MPLPGGLTTITVTGTYLNALGQAQSGTVSFTPSTEVIDAAGTTVLTQTAITASLNTSGAFSLGPIPCTDNAALVPPGWSYTVTVAVGGAQQTITPVYLPHALGSTVDISLITPGPAVPASSGVLYLPNGTGIPTQGPSLGGGFLYANNGALFWRGGNNTLTQVAPA